METQPSQCSPHRHQRGFPWGAGDRSADKSRGRCRKNALMPQVERSHGGLSSLVLQSGFVTNPDCSTGPIGSHGYRRRPLGGLGRRPGPWPRLTPRPGPATERSRRVAGAGSRCRPEGGRSEGGLTVERNGCNSRSQCRPLRPAVHRQVRMSLTTPPVRRRPSARPAQGSSGIALGIWRS